MNDIANKLSSLDWEFYKNFKFKDNQVLWFNYTDMNIRGLTFQPLINFIIRYFKITHYTEIGIAVGTNFFTTCNYIGCLKIPCVAHGVSLYDVPIDSIGRLKDDNLIVSKILEKDNSCSFAKISRVSLSDNIINYLDQKQPGLIVLNQISHFQIENINNYYEAAADNSILIISRHMFDVNSTLLFDHIKLHKFKYLETKYAAIIFKNVDSDTVDHFVKEFEPYYKNPLDSLMRLLMEKAKYHQTAARNSDLFNLNFVKPHQMKHFFSVIGLFRNESMALREWIEHYIKFGADHFYLVDNNSTDDYYGILRPYIERGLISLYSCKEEKYQLGMLRELTNVLKNETIWSGAFDLDEFIYPPHLESIPDVIRKFEAFEAIVIPWLVFGSNGHIKQPESIVSGFTKRVKYEGNNSHTKSIVKTSTINILTQHIPWTKNNIHVRSDGKVIHKRPTKIKLFEEEIPQMQLLNNHYALQSQEFFQKVKVGRTEVAENCTSNKSFMVFAELDKYANEIVDEKLVKK